MCCDDDNTLDRSVRDAEDAEEMNDVNAADVVVVVVEGDADRAEYSNAGSGAM